MTSQWAPRHIKSPSFQLFTQPFVQPHIKENIKSPRHWPLWGESIGHRFHLLTSSWISWGLKRTSWIWLFVIAFTQGGGVVGLRAWPGSLQNTPIYSGIKRLTLNMMTLSNGNIFRITGPLCGEFTGHRWIPHKRPVTRSFDVFFNLRLNNGWANIREAGDLRRHRVHYDVTIILLLLCVSCILASTKRSIQYQWQHRIPGARLANKISIKFLLHLKLSWRV